MAMRRILAVLVAVALPVFSAVAQDDAPAVSALPFESPQHRITPAQSDPNDDAILSTHSPAALPWQQPAAAPAPMVLPATNPGLAPAKPLLLPAKSPFGRASSGGVEGAPIPASPHTDAVPVENVDSIQQSEPAAPTPVAPGANPVAEDPAQPTELTAPLFSGPDSGAPRTVVLRALNKVTAQAVLLDGRPGDTLKFGQLVITPITCRVSDPTSQRDDAGLVDIKENVPGKQELQPLFRGWMYASSPSINALEHPVYDISMAECKIVSAVKKTEEKPAAKADKKAPKK